MPKELPDVLDFSPPAQAKLTTAIQRYWHRPEFSGWENIDPDQPALFVGNHTIYGMLDAPFIIEEVYREKGIFIRGLSDRLHFTMPYGNKMLSQGAILGTRENCSRLMEDGQSLLVYPGGGREVAKRKGEADQLTWKKRLGFAKMAVQHGYPIIPIASVGPNDCYDIHIDANDVMDSWVGKLLEKTGVMKKYLRGGDAIMPISTGLGYTLISKPERFYFSFGKPITTSEYAGLEDDEDALWKVRKKTEKSLYAQLKKLRSVQAGDPARYMRSIYR